MKRFLLATTLGCVLSVSAIAGEIPTSGSPSPPPNGMTQATPSTLPADTANGGVTAQISDAVLSTLLNMFSLLAV